MRTVINVNCENIRHSSWTLVARTMCFVCIKRHYIMHFVGCLHYFCFVLSYYSKGQLVILKFACFHLQSDEEGRKASYDVLNGINSELRNSSNGTSDGPYHKIISMVSAMLSFCISKLTIHIYIFLQIINPNILS